MENWVRSAKRTSAECRGRGASDGVRVLCVRAFDSAFRTPHSAFGGLGSFLQIAHHPDFGSFRSAPSRPFRFVPQYRPSAPGARHSEKPPTAQGLDGKPLAQNWVRFAIAPSQRISVRFAERPSSADGRRYGNDPATGGRRTRKRRCVFRSARHLSVLRAMCAICGNMPFVVAACRCSIPSAISLHPCRSWCSWCRGGWLCR